jgi:adenylate cyclase class 2
MKPEIEAKFLSVNHDELRSKLQALGAACAQPMRLMKRKNYDFPDGRLAKEKNGWVRVRDEGDKITLSYKQLNSRELDGTHEVNITVSSFKAADDFLTAIGLTATSYQETKRESWRLDDFEIELDEWPWAKPYIEIEGPDEKSLKELAQKLELDWARVCHGSVEVVYREEYYITD